ncbi:MAG: hypothetical protein F4W95_10445 [Chloroflexi bacterium]|nr:hypothetical protein [Chloroflexota bacterium]MYD48891.1 hypothetical protein [Chloroflexota bacterium]
MTSKRGRIPGMNPESRYTVIEAEVPHAGVQRYSQDLSPMPGGRGSYRFEFDHYEQSPELRAARHRHRQASQSRSNGVASASTRQKMRRRLDCRLIATIFRLPYESLRIGLCR